jgi:hypothetical protein
LQNNAASKKVGARAAPKEAAKKTTGKKVKKENVLDEEEDDGVNAVKAEFTDQGEDILDDEQYGKLSPSVPVTPGNDTYEVLSDISCEIPWESVMNGIETTFPAGYSFSYDATEDELYHAHSHHITVEPWRVWKAQTAHRLHSDPLIWSSLTIVPFSRSKIVWECVS